MGKIRRRELIIILGFGLLYVFGILILSGSLFSGYHWLDDHEIVLMNSYFENGEYSWRTFFEKGLFRYFGKDIRFRPLYDSLRLFHTWLFGNNFILWSVWVGIVIVCCIAIGYLVARNMGGSIISSGLVALLTVTGEQVEVWWRLGPQEPIGLLLFLLCIWTIQEYERTSKKRWGVLSIIFAFLSAASKESFTILLPGLGMLCIAFDFFYNEYMLNLKSIFFAIKKNFIIVLFMFLNFIINIYVIATKVGFLSINYAGIDVEQGVVGYLKWVGSLLDSTAMKTYVFVFCISIIMIICIKLFYKKHFRSKVHQKDIILAIPFVFMLLLELILYAKSGLHGRYFIPFTFMFWVLHIISLPRYWEGKRVPSGFFLLVLAVILLKWYSGAWKGAEDFAEQGKILNKGFRVIENTLEADDKIVTCIDGGGELDYSFTVYAKIELGMQEVYCKNTEGDIVSLQGENPNEIIILSDADCIVIPNEADLKSMEIEGEDYRYLADLGYGMVFIKMDQQE